MTFPKLEENTWRANWPCIVTLKDGKKISAYSVHGLIEDNQLNIGTACKVEMWLVLDTFVEHESIKDLNNARYICVEDVIEWIYADNG